MSQIINNYNILKQEVSDYQDLILKITTTDNAVKDIYKGCQVLFSPLIERPEILFIGINPGAGYLDRYGESVNKLTPQNELEYLSSGENYRLLQETIKVFKDADKMDNLKGAVKTNHCFFATKSTADLSLLVKKLDNAGLSPNVKFDDWTRRLIKMINPEIIICEGVNAFGKTCKVLDLNSSSASSNWGDDACTLLKEKDYKVVGYYRRLSNIVNKAALSELLKSVLR